MIQSNFSLKLKGHQGRYINGIEKKLIQTTKILVRLIEVIDVKCFMIFGIANYRDTIFVINGFNLFDVIYQSSKNMSLYCIKVFVILEDRDIC